MHEMSLTQIIAEIDITELTLNINEELLKFITDPDILKELLHQIIDEPEEDIDFSVRYRNGNKACQILILDVGMVLDKIANNTQMLDILWMFAHRPPPLNSLTASFFTKVMTILFQQKTEPVFHYLKFHDAVNTLLIHIETGAIMEFYIEMVTVEVELWLKREINDWLSQERLIEKLINSIHPCEDEVKQYYAGQLLGELILLSRCNIPQYIFQDDVQIVMECPLLLKFEHSNTIERLISNILNTLNHPNSSNSLINGISTILCFLDFKQDIIKVNGHILNPLYSVRMRKARDVILEAICRRISDFYYALMKHFPNVSIENSAGLLAPPLGSVRLCISSLVASLIATRSTKIVDSITNTGLLDTLLDLFSSYEWHNILHTNVYKSIHYSLNFEMGGLPDKRHLQKKFADKLIKHLFVECHLIQRCLTLWKLNDISEKSRSLRKGYMGHLTKIVNEIQQCRENGPSMKTIQSMFYICPYDIRDEWADLIKEKLDEINKKNEYPFGHTLPQMIAPVHETNNNEYLPERILTFDERIDAQTKRLSIDFEKVSIQQRQMQQRQNISTNRLP